MSEVKKAVIPVAGHGNKLYPATKIIKKELFPLVDSGGCVKPIIQIILEEAIDSGIEEVCLVVQPGDEKIFRAYFENNLPAELQDKLQTSSRAEEQSRRIEDLGRHIIYVEQSTQEGYGHAVYCAHEWVGQEPFLLLLGDHVYISHSKIPCAGQLIEAFQQHGSSMSAVCRTPESNLRYYGTIGGKRLHESSRVIQVTKIKEKPDPAYARIHLRVPGVPDNEYLCWFGQHLFTPSIFEALKYQIDDNVREKGEIQLTSAQELLMRAEGKYLAFETAGESFDTGEPAEYVNTVSNYFKRV